MRVSCEHRPFADRRVSRRPGTEPQEIPMVTLTPARRTRSTFPAFPFRTLGRLEDELRRMPGWLAETDVEEFGWHPAVDVVEKDDAFVLTAELPGMERDDVEVEVESDVLRIRGDKEEVTEKEEEEGAWSYRVSERSFGGFSRSFTLPRSIDAGEIEATFRNGILTVRMPKREVARGRKIAIED